jgi:hypothetical protein
MMTKKETETEVTDKLEDDETTPIGKLFMKGRK